MGERLTDLVTWHIDICVLITCHFNAGSFLKESTVEGKPTVNTTWSEPKKTTAKQPSNGTSTENAGKRNTSAETSMYQISLEWCPAPCVFRFVICCPTEGAFVNGESSGIRGRRLGA